MGEGGGQGHPSVGVVVGGGGGGGRVRGHVGGVGHAGVARHGGPARGEEVVGGVLGGVRGVVAGVHHLPHLTDIRN